MRPAPIHYGCSCLFLLAPACNGRPWEGDVQSRTKVMSVHIHTQNIEIAERDESREVRVSFLPTLNIQILYSYSGTVVVCHPVFIFVFSARKIRRLLFSQLAIQSVREDRQQRLFPSTQSAQQQYCTQHKYFINRIHIYVKNVNKKILLPSK